MKRLQEGIRHQQQGALDTAEAIYRRVLRDEPDHPDAIHLLGVVTLLQGDPESAIRLIQRAVDLRPDEAHFRLNLGNAWEACGDHQQAILSFEQSLRCDPQLTLAWNNLANLLSNLGELEPAIDCLQQALRLNQDNVVAWINLGALHQQQGDLESACSCYERALTIDPGNHQARVNRAAVLRSRGQPEQAAVELRAVLRDGGNSAEVHYNLANALCDCGDFDAARQHYEHVLNLNPRAAKVIFNLAGMTRFQTEDRERLTTWEALASRADASDEERTWLQFALGKARNDLQEFDAAFRHYAEGNSLVRTSFDPAAHRARIDDTLTTFSPGFWAEHQDWGLSTERPLFIVGMPRSGTTLIEQILATHSQVFAAGERVDADLLIRECRERHQSAGSDSAAARGVSPAEVWTMATQYVQQVFPEKASGVVTDKMPTNFLRLGWIALWFPRARVIHCRRDPCDVCLSCYFQHFTHQLPFAYDLDHLVVYYREYERLMRHWQESLPVPILDVQYEELVAEPEPVIRQMLTFCELDWQPDCLRFQDTRRPVGTASHWQVRQPLYSSSRGRWRNYREHIGVLLKAFGNGDDCITR